MIQRFLYAVPWSYAVLSKISQNIKLFKEDTNQISLILNKYFPDRIIKNGPFAGMKYIDESHGSSLLPKISWTYEYLLTTWIKEIINTDYHNIIDIGSAEWYYAVWLALKTSAHIYAFDQSIKAQQQLNQLAIENKCLPSITIAWICDYTSIKSIVNQGETIIICDIEWSEKELLNNDLCDDLNKCDILVECHDFIQNWICDSLIQRFQSTHNIRILCDKYEKDMFNLKEEYGDDYDFITWENRAVDNMKRLFMTIK